MNAMEANGDNTRRLLTLLSQGHPIVMDAMKSGRFEALSMLGFSSAAAAYVKDLGAKCDRPKMNDPMTTTVTAGNWEHDEFIIVGSDGFWNAYSPQVIRSDQCRRRLACTITSSALL
jgi:serine/threonine protein phosphatase PrpC